MLYEDKNFIAGKIKEARKKALMTQEQLAEQIGISAKQLSRIENGDYIPSLITFLNLIQILNIDINDFGIKITNNSNAIRDKFLKLVYCMNDDELEFFYGVILNIKNNIFKITNQKKSKSQ